MKVTSKEEFIHSVHNNDIVKISEYLENIWNKDGIVNQHGKLIEDPEKAIMLMQSILISMNDYSDELFIMLSKSLLKHNIDLYEPFIEVITLKSEEEHINLLFSNNLIDKNDKDKIYHLLKRLIANWNSNSVKAVIEKDVCDLNYAPDGEENLLYISFNSNKCLKTMFEMGANPNLLDKNGNTIVDLLDKELKKGTLFISKTTEQLIREYSEFYLKKDILEEKERLEFKRFCNDKAAIKSKEIKKIRGFKK